MPTDADMRAGFMKAVREEPSEDFHRLVFADWLEENGDERDAAQAEFIRVQCKLAGQPSRCDCMCEYECATDCAAVIHGRLRLKEDELVRFNASHWIWGALPPEWLEGFGTWRRPMPKIARIISKRSVCREVEFRRGFIAEVRCTFQAWLKDGGAMVGAQPIEVVRPTDKEPYSSPDEGRWYWMAECSPVHPEHRSALDFVWYELGRTRNMALNGREMLMNEGYVSEQEAYDDLSETLIRLAKKAENEP